MLEITSNIILFKFLQIFFQFTYFTLGLYFGIDLISGIIIYIIFSYNYGRLLLDVVIICQILIPNIGKIFLDNYDYFCWRYNQKIFVIRKCINIIEKIINFILSIFAIYIIASGKLDGPEYFYIFYSIVYILNFIYIIIFEPNEIHSIYYLYLEKNTINTTNISFTRNITNVDKECSICLDNNSIEWVELKCKHKFHYDCINNWININNTCPICRQ